MLSLSIVYLLSFCCLYHCVFLWMSMVWHSVLLGETILLSLFCVGVPISLQFWRVCKNNGRICLQWYGIGWQFVHRIISIRFAGQLNCQLFGEAFDGWEVGRDIGVGRIVYDKIAWIARLQAKMNTATKFTINFIDKRCISCLNY